MKIELTLKELQKIIKCMRIADEEYGPLEDKEFYNLLKKLKKIEKGQSDFTTLKE